VRGKGLFREPLPLCIIANYPSWDRFVFAIHPRTGIKSLADIKAKRIPLKLSTREDPTHSTRDLINQVLGLYAYSLADLESWGGRLQLNGGPGDARRLKAIADGAVDAIFDEGLALWLGHALAHGYRPLTLEPEIFKHLGEIGWRRVVMPKGLYPGLESDHACLDYSAWPLYARTDLPEEDAYKIVDAINARQQEIVWENFNAWAPFHSIGALGEETEATPRDVPLHPGAARWFREHGYKV
jgi:TRAP-type uncharacterized transport system substrate-binding protein